MNSSFSTPSKNYVKFSVFLFSMLDSTDSAICNIYKTMKILPPFAIVVNTSTAVAIIAAWFVIACCACWCVLYSNKFLVACPPYIQQILYYPFLWVMFLTLQINILDISNGMTFQMQNIKNLCFFCKHDEIRIQDEAQLFCVV